METKEELMKGIKEWVNIDNQIAKLKSETREKTIRRKELTEILVNVMKKNEIDIFNINGGALVYKQNKIKKTITGKMLLESLQTYYKDKPVVAEELTKYILDNRQETVKETIRRKIDK
jgi:hypothetical protein